jgi:hypothetical protein
MKTKIQYKYLYGFLIFIIPFLASCIPDNLKDKMDESMRTAQNMFADQEFKKVLGQIELHKLRNGTYPVSLNQLQFLSILDSSSINYVEYHKLDSGYELNITYKFPSVTGKKETPVELHYPANFWKGLGCVKTNAK